MIWNQDKRFDRAWEFLGVGQYVIVYNQGFNLYRVSSEKREGYAYLGYSDDQFHFSTVKSNFDYKQIETIVEQEEVDEAVTYCMLLNQKRKECHDGLYFQG